MWKKIQSHFKVLNPEGISITEEPFLLKISRIITFCLIVLMFVIYFVFGPITYFLYLTNWGIFISGGYYVLVYVSSKRCSLRSSCCIILHAIWSIEVAITGVFWAAIYPFVDIEWNWLIYLLAIPPHGLYVIGLGIELRHTYVICKRGWVMLPIGIVLLYSVVNIPYTLTVGEVYPYVNYTNAWSYLVIFMLLSFIFIGSELAFQMTKRRNEFFDKLIIDEKSLININTI